MRYFRLILICLILFSSFGILLSGEIIVFRPPDKFYKPPHTKGDRDFMSHGPRIKCRVSLKISDRFAVRDIIKCRISMKAEEVEYDWTTARGATEYIIYRAPARKQIAKILSDTSSYARYLDNDYGEDVINLKPWDLVKTFKFIGDVWGSEAGTKTRVKVVFNPIQIRLIAVPSLAERIISYKPRSRSFMPPRTRGDRDFWGRGPSVTCTVSLKLIKVGSSRHNDGIECYIAMRAEEDGGDFTTARGSMTYMLYRVPAGKKIEKILDAGMVYHHYRDNDYRDDTFYKRFGPVSKLVFVGDTWGSEAGTRTKVTVHFRTLKIVVADI